MFEGLLHNVLFWNPPWFDFFVNHILFWICWGSLALMAYNIAVHKSVPNIRTAPAIRERVISLLQEDRAKRKLSSYTVIDLGSGNGQFTREIARAMPQAKVIGIEITRHTVLWANFMKRLARLDNLEYRHMNFLDFDFSVADAVVMYQMPHFMDGIGKKLHSEARSGTFITSNKFRIGDGWEPFETMRIKTLYLHQGYLHLYRKA